MGNQHYKKHDHGGKGCVMKEMEWHFPEGSLSYVKQGSGIWITGYHGLAGQVTIPERLPWQEDSRREELAVKGIGKKAFLSKKYLRSLIMPKSIEMVEDWAFAYCDSLREVRFPGADVQFGKAVFMECPALRCISFPMEKTEEAGGMPDGSKEGQEGIGALVAAAVTQMDASYLLNAREAGSREWLEKWDARMLAILRAADDEGYSKQILCGEEDYESADLETYLRNSRKKKVRLLLLRLYWPVGLDPALREQLEKYLLTHSKGCKTEETWQVIRDECGDRREFYELFARLGCLTRENAPLVIAETREDCPEMKAFFLKYQADHFSQVDYFADMEL
ncbi:MAG: leucine-rich repeat protein [Lachnospiraceae bacterium]|nr:leucine-rich repeat protein [Lachnospiraceae bacterium]